MTTKKWKMLNYTYDSPKSNRTFYNHIDTNLKLEKHSTHLHQGGVFFWVLKNHGGSDISKSEHTHIETKDLLYSICLNCGILMTPLASKLWHHCSHSESRTYCTYINTIPPSWTLDKLSRPVLWTCVTPHHKLWPDNCKWFQYPCK